MNENALRVQRRGGAIILLLLAIATTIVFTWEHNKHAAATARAQGEVVTRNTAGIRDSSVTRQRLSGYTLRFTRNSGEEVYFDAFPIPLLKLHPGQRYPVRFDPNQPERAWVDSFPQLHHITTWMLGIFVIMLLFYLLNTRVLLPMVLGKIADGR